MIGLKNAGVAARGWAARGVLALTLLCGLAPGAYANFFQLPPNVISTEDEDITNSLYQWTSSKGIYGGGGQEPMIDLQADLQWTGGYQVDMWVGGDITYKHKILPIEGLPDGFSGTVPFFFDMRIAGEEDGYSFLSAQVCVNGKCSPHFYYAVGSINYSETLQGWAEPGTELNATLLGGIRCTVSEWTRTASAQLVVDPYIYIDPSWEYAEYFGVFQAADPAGTGSYDYLVTRDWMAPVPIPGAVWLFASGLIGLVGLRRKFRKS